MITKKEVINLITKKLPSSQVSVENIKGDDHLQVTVIACLLYTSDAADDP